MSLYSRILGHPFVYNEIRPRVVGGIDLSPVFARLGAKAGDTILDLGCGTGDALNYLDDFDSYLGVDVDPVAIRYAKKHHGGRANVRLECKYLDEDDVRALAPTHIVLGGLLHHLNDQAALSLLRMVKASPRLVRVVTTDIVFLPGELINNIFARLDRGRHCREQSGYESLVEKAGFSLESAEVLRSHPKRGRVKYLLLSLAPGQK